jgi:propionyl-CoA synthetase
VAAFKNAVFVLKLPKTRSGKIARNTLKDMINNKPFKV